MQTRNAIVMVVAAVLNNAACGSSDSDTAGSADDLKAPTELKAEPLEGAAHLTWTDNSKEAEFMIERRTQSADWMTIASVPFDTTQYHDANLDPAMTYMYRVTPMGKDGTHGPHSMEAPCMPHMGAGAAGSGHTGH